jgi:hypothetical protein
MKSRTSYILIAVLTGLCCLASVQAQEAQNEGIARTAMITAKDGQEDTLLKAIADYHHWVAKFEGHHQYTWYRILTGPNTGKFVARSGGHNWADFDTKHDWQEEADKVFEQNVVPHIENTEVHFTEDMSEFSHWPESFDEYTHYSVQDWYVHNGQYGAFRRHLKKITEALKAGGFPHHWGFLSVESGGYGNHVQLVGANKGWGDMSESNPTFYEIMGAALGGEEAFEAFMAEWGSTYKNGNQWMVELIPEASDYGTD